MQGRRRISGGKCMRLVTDEEMKSIDGKQCPRCRSQEIDVEFARASIDSYCNGCGLTWTMYNDGKTIIW